MEMRRVNAIVIDFTAPIYESAAEVGEPQPHTEDPRKQDRNSIASRRRNTTIMMALPPIVVLHRIVGHVAARKLTLFGGLHWAGVNEPSSREVTGFMRLRSRKMTDRHVCASCRSRGMSATLARSRNSSVSVAAATMPSTRSACSSSGMPSCRFDANHHGEHSNQSNKDVSLHKRIHLKTPPLPKYMTRNSEFKPPMSPGLEALP
jgi:hypothetical protein